jgi:RNA polymerase sigma factor (sigma-70 family)
LIGVVAAHFCFFFFFQKKTPTLRSKPTPNCTQWASSTQNNASGMTTRPDPPTALLRSCQQGDTRAQRQFFERYHPPLFAVCLRYARDRPEAQDFLQEAFITIFRDLHQYKSEGPLEGWLRKVTVRVALQALRRKHALRFASDFDALSADALDPVLPDQELNVEAILRLVQQLPDGARAVFNLRCLEGFSYAEIADSLGLVESSVRSQYTRACQQLRHLVECNLLLL